MQWLINIITERVLESMSGIISQWHGLLVDIPDGWVLCDGTNGTPDLSGRFIFGTVFQGAMGGTGGVAFHNHDFTSNTHDHGLTMNLTAEDIAQGTELIGTQQGPVNTDTEVVTGTTDNKTSLPPYYQLAFIMKT